MLKGKGLLSPLQKEFLALFARISDQRRFYLTGGTALAEFYMGHRLSFDLDLFTADEELIAPVSYQIEQLCSQSQLALSVQRRFASFVELQISHGEDTLKVDLALDSPFRFEEPVISDAGVLVNDLQDLQIDKLLAYYGRSEPRDAVDFFLILQQNPLEELLQKARKKDPGFDIYWFAIALQRSSSFPDDIERWPVKMRQELDVIELKRSFQALANELMGGITQAGANSI